ncbi:hypothetical protein FPSE_04180 [Fusarium pseudograminearum CS3096]|uniref:Uncharacterized protein n=1 Tax=Fusarium pseudograminearum (strain CS3096) TaxID=1028729 RepID=K3VM13_FUSPC|nr:hypothetical protein FPSE_04180 [Fusarium pseudograminearum CS3096]EKJ75679.1 hypothetical protein FPSE_04180 [Fusarium pseudograminearum CS3096]
MNEEDSLSNVKFYGVSDSNLCWDKEVRVKYH